MDRKQRELGKDGNATAEVVSADAPATTSPKISKTEELFRQGEELYALGMYQQAIHVWTRILFLERGDARAKTAIELAKRAVAEQLRELDAEIAAAARELDAGALEDAAARVRHVLSVDPRHTEGHQLAESLAARRRRLDQVRVTDSAASVGEAETLPASRRGLLLRVSRGSAEPESRRRASSSIRAEPNVGIKTALQMAAFVLAVVLVFASGGLYLYLNWESIVSDGAFTNGVAGVGGGTIAFEASVPTPSELHFYNGARLYEKGRYRQALAELSLVAHDDEVFDRARSLILRIEERLLRSGELSTGTGGGDEPVPPER